MVQVCIKTVINLITYTTVDSVTIIIIVIIIIIISPSYRLQKYLSWQKCALSSAIQWLWGSSLWKYSSIYTSHTVVVWIVEIWISTVSDIENDRKWCYNVCGSIVSLEDQATTNIDEDATAYIICIISVVSDLQTINRVKPIFHHIIYILTFGQEEPAAIWNLCLSHIACL